MLAGQPQAGALKPGANDSDQHARNDADRRQPERHQKAADKAATIERIVKDREIDSGRIVQRTEPIPERLHRPSQSETITRTRPGTMSPRLGLPLRADGYLYLAFISCANLVGLMPHFFSSC